MILSLIAAAIVGRMFFSLAHDHYRSEWGFAILGGATIVVTQFVSAFVLVIIFMNRGSNFTSTGTSIMISLLGLGIGAVASWILYALLKKAWTKNPKNQKENSDLIDQ